MTRMSAGRIRENLALQFVVFVMLSSPTLADDASYLDDVRLPPGFEIEVFADGSLLISDDSAGKIYRIRYEEPSN